MKCFKCGLPAYWLVEDQVDDIPRATCEEHVALALTGRVNMVTYAEENGTEMQRKKERIENEIAESCTW